MRQIVSAACGLVMGFAAAAPAVAQTGGADPVVVELYTSQGCSSCPPADDLMGRLAQDGRVIALALHVDYWDYLGWKDAFARPEFTKRQKAYAKASGSRMIFTPQIIVAGQDSVVGTREGEVEAAIRRHALAAAARGQQVRLTLRREGDVIHISAEAVPPADRTFRVQLVRFTPSAEVAIERGENAGHRLTYHNIVTSWQVVGDWQATGPLELAAPAAGADPAVVIIQADGPGEVMAAAALR
ncbi:MAG TPA: DUF1223 domain-containing protein [Paracoccaceae bacterium]|nr:DUF1223 domain-containing protein [Paracoccaceae bacterium]HMO72216.1 DUF1223 domain-containing protein [Paracoccaceae bacterium]